jgi:N-acyl-D-aspartate/D-glutamate deacylase
VPEVTAGHIAACVERLVEGGFREVMTVDADGVLTSAARAMVRDALDQRALSASAATVPGHFIDIHTADDLEVVADRLRTRSLSDASPPHPRSTS